MLSEAFGTFFLLKRLTVPQIASTCRCICTRFCLAQLFALFFKKGHAYSFAFSSKLKTPSIRRQLEELCSSTEQTMPKCPYTTWPQGDLNTAYAPYFIGNSYLASLETEHGGPVNVTFEPKCRNNWHIHHKSVQILICVAGHGWYQEWGKEAVALKAGMVIAIPEGAKHWHGAAKDDWLQHLTYTTNTLEGASTEWLEAVEDALYLNL